MTNAQKAALSALDTWRAGYWIPTRNLQADGVTPATLKSLSEADMVESQKDGRATYWRMTPAGRAALEANGGRDA